MSTEFEREERYIVFKLSDVEEHFTPGEKQQLARLVEVQRAGREEAGKPLLRCVVVEKDWPEYEPTWRAIEARVAGERPAPKAVAYLDLGVGGYMDIGTDLTDEALAALPKGRHMLGIVGTYGVDGYVPAQPAPSVPENWLRAIDDALVSTHVGVASLEDTYEQAKAKLDSLIGFHVDAATDPAVNGGRRLVPIEPTEKMVNEGTCASTLPGPRYIDEECVKQCWEYMLAAAQEAKP